MKSFFITAYLCMYLVAVIKPKWGVYLIWPVMWLYPGGLLHAMLPLHIRLDDLYLVWISLIIFISSLGTESRPSKIVWLVSLWFLCILIGNAFGAMGSPREAYAEIIRNVSKRLYAPLIAYCLWKTSTDEKSIKNHILFIMLAAIATLIIGIVQVKAPQLTVAWENPGWLYGDSYSKEKFSEEIRRAGGALETIYYAITAMSMLLLFIRFSVQNFGSKMMRLISFIGIPISGLGLIYSNTRSDYGAAAVGVFYMLLRQKKRGLLLMFCAVFVIYLLVGTDLVTRITSRFGLLEQTQYKYDIRTLIWSEYLRNFSFHYLLFGRGMIPEQIRIGYTAHSSYVAAFAYTGLIGFITTIALFWYLYKNARTLLKWNLSVFSNTLAESFLAVMFASLFVGFFAEETFYGHQMRLMAALGVLVERYIFIAEEQDSYAELEQDSGNI